jgi:hypothetical protein
MNRQQIAYDYLVACKTQESYEQQLTNAVRLFRPDNEVVSVADPLRRAYNNLVSDTLGARTFEWLLWWQYECDYGKHPKAFEINNVEYREVTQLEFTHIITK